MKDEVKDEEEREESSQGCSTNKNENNQSPLLLIPEATDFIENNKEPNDVAVSSGRELVLSE